MEETEALLFPAINVNDSVSKSKKGSLSWKEQKFWRPLASHVHTLRHFQRDCFQRIIVLTWLEGINVASSRLNLAGRHQCCRQMISQEFSTAMVLLSLGIVRTRLVRDKSTWKNLCL